MELGKITVFTPTYNRANSLGRVYDSLCQQTYRNFEWIVIDDGSSDGTEEVIRQYKSNANFPIYYIYQENSGKHVAINRAVERTDSEFFIIADSDDAFKPEALKTFIDAWNAIPDEKKENFKDGYLTYIHGYIPKFSFEYELSLKDDLKKMGVTDVFEQGKSNLSNMTDDDSLYIDSAKHKANIEFTQDGIKAAAATMAGGAGAGDWYDYFIDMPTENIDISFDKPYMFLIRDKKTGETWFVGTVYEPLDIKDEPASYTEEAWEEREEN